MTDPAKIVESLLKTCKADHIHKVTKYGVPNWTCVQMKAAAAITELEKERDEAIQETLDTASYGEERESKLVARVTELEKWGNAVLYHDERGQGVLYAEAMNGLKAALAKGDSND